MPKLTIKGNALNPSVKLSENNSFVTMSADAGLTINGTYNINGSDNLPLTIRGLTDIEVNDNCKLTVASSELPLNNINIVHGAIDLNNNYEGAVAVAISVGENSKFTQTGKDLPMNAVTICAQSDFNFTHHGVDYNIHNSAPATNSAANGAYIASITGAGTKIEFKNPHEKLDSIIEIAKNLESASLNDFKKYEEGKEESKKFIDLLSGTNNLSDKVQKIDSHINQHYFELTKVVQHNSTVESDLGLPNEILAHISSYLNLSDIKLDLAGENHNFTGE
nr:hypothetical protein [Rickettsia endosymbiont of Ceutorhynchus assimilis]